ncbi:MAG TPA: CehA/McbA family metallohydrolase [Vicinamibacterales bacterium]|jgi:hypothetical protein
MSGIRVLRGAGVVLAVALLAVLVLMPPAPARLVPPSWQPQTTARGVFHIHTQRSDGTGTVDEVAAAAARAGLDFVIITDHGDGSRQPDRPAYRAGVLVIDGVEISTTGGHYAALGLGRTPYPLGGEPRDVVEDVHRFGGFGVVTHPDSPKAALAWPEWELPFDAVEWLNGDSQWRDASAPRLIRAIATYPLQPVGTLAALISRPATLERWSRLAVQRPIVALAGTDAHARVGWRHRPDPYEDHAFVRLPSYEASFRTSSLQVLLLHGLSGQPAEDAAAVLDGIRAGRVHSVLDGRAGPAVFEFSARSGPAAAREGETLALTDPAVIRVRANVPAGGRIVLFRDGVEVHRVRAQELTYATDRPGGYRAEVWLSAGTRAVPVPWIVGNPIYVGTRPRTPARDPIAAGEVVAKVTPAGAWHMERDGVSAGDVGRLGDDVRLTYRLGPSGTVAPYAALIAGIAVPAGASFLTFHAVADRPMRVSVQLRKPAGGEGERWHRSVYLDLAPREIVIPLVEMTPVGATSRRLPALAAVDSLLFVVDTVNAGPGASGSFTVSNVRLLGAQASR